MSETETEEKSLSTLQSAFRAAIGLGIFALLTAGLIALTKVGTNERIAEQEAQAQLKALYALVPEALRDNDLLQDNYQLVLDDAKAPRTVYLAKTSAKVEAIVLPWVAPNGYTGPIDMIVGIKANGELLGVRVLKHQETPGLGDKIELSKSDWILSFDGKSVQNTPDELWRVKKDGGTFDQLTGATITPRAVVAAVHDSLKLFEQNKAQLLSQESGGTLTLNTK